MDFNTIRKQIPATQQVVYLNTGWSGPSPQPVVDAIVNAVRYENDEGPTCPPVFEHHKAIRVAARADFATMLGVTPEEITLTSNTTHGLNLVLSGLDWRAGDELITDDLEHSSGLVPAYYLRERHGVNVKIVHLNALDSADTVVDKLEQAITSRTRLFVLSHIMYTTGLCIPLADINKMAHAKGVQVLVDAAQSLGQLPLDMKAMDCDYYAGPGHKWLLGPEGTGALYIRRDLLPSVTPIAVAGRSALSHDHAGNFEPAIDTPEKFELTSANGPMLAGVSAAVAFLQGIGMDNIEGRWRDLTERLRQRLAAIPGVAVTSPAAGPTACGLVTWTVDGWEPRSLVEALWQQEKINIRAVGYPPGVRASVDFFNSEDEMDLVADTVRKLAAKGPE